MLRQWRCAARMAEPTCCGLTLKQNNGRQLRRFRSSTGWTTSCMRWSCDRTGFPVLELPALNLGVHLLPVAKAQFERFLAEPQRELYGDLWYEKLLDVSPRIAPREARAGDVESLLLAGILPAEISRFVEWLGEGFALPTTESWRALDAAIREQPLTSAEVDALRSDAGLNRQ